MTKERKGKHTLLEEKSEGGCVYQGSVGVVWEISNCASMPLLKLDMSGTNGSLKQLIEVLDIL